MRPMRGVKTIRSLRTIATDMPSFRTYAAAITNSPPNYPLVIDFAPRSPNLRHAYNGGHRPVRAATLPPIDQRNNAPEAMVLV
jgi:hypothetical protein